MNNTEIKDLLIEVSNGLANAQEELNRPTEHVVTYSVCRSTHTAIKKMMFLYLTSHGIACNDEMSLDELFSLCHKTNPAFSGVDIAEIACKDLDGNECNKKYCLAVDDVNCCTNVAGQMKNVIWEDLGIK